ncbi:hypothetical protein RN001_010594 [Aquatica leii]|uniref:Arrestin C-terminal-like domain-containing protein n=1 Tax=Aquatica leii TaxID=1421715 RepID=A0AAN7QHK5_9COLE|nr:hypothetical protein RN001_010594 [Aquatica leii]
MSNEIQIYLDNYNDYCIPGQTINGRLVCNFTSEKQIRAILVNFTGKCDTSWTESESYYDDFFKEDRTRDIHFSGGEIYFDEKLNLAGDQGTFTLPAGKHVYNFLYKLPEHLPSSYNSPDNRGTVQYLIKAIIDSPWKFNTKAVVMLNLISPLDLNYVPRVREPVEISLDKTVCSCWCSCSDAVTFTFSLPSTGFVPGQSIRVGIYVQNLTRVNVQQVKFKVTEFIEIKATTPHTSSKYDKQVIAECVESGVGAHGEKSWTAVLDIPRHRHYPNLIPCNLINISYKIKGEAVLPCPHSNLTASLPITIGQVQLTGVDVSATLGPPSDWLDPTAPTVSRTLIMPNSDRRNYGSMQPTAPLNSIEHQMPPTYEEVQKDMIRL